MAAVPLFWDTNMAAVKSHSIDPAWGILQEIFVFL